jgi:hypothetical protein
MEALHAVQAQERSAATKLRQWKEAATDGKLGELTVDVRE